MNGRPCNDHDLATWLAIDAIRQQGDAAAEAAAAEAAAAEAVAAEATATMEASAASVASAASAASDARLPPDVLVVGCQEYVPLNAQQLLPVFSAKTAEFERLLLAMLRHTHGVRYVALRGANSRDHCRDQQIAIRACEI